MIKKMKIVGRHEKVAFMGIAAKDGAVTYRHMYGFTEMSESKNPIEYTRKYVDEKSERSDITGYNTALSFAFDEIKEDPICQHLADIIENERVGEAAIVPILQVDLSQETETAGSYPARLRYFTVVPDSAGDDENAYTYSGEFKANGETVVGTATTTDGWDTCVFTEETEA